MQWPHVPTTTVPGWQGEAFTHNKQVEISNQWFFFLSYYISNINSNKRSSPLASYSIYFLGGGFPTGALRLAPRWRRRPLV